MFFKANATGSTLTPLLPLIEAFFVANSHGSGLQRITEPSESTTTPRLSRFIKFAEHYRYLHNLLNLWSSLSLVSKYWPFSSRKLLNDLIKQNPSLLEESFSVLLSSAHLIDFENKRSFFKAKVAKHKGEADAHYSEVRLNVRYIIKTVSFRIHFSIVGVVSFCNIFFFLRRSHVFEDSYYQLRTRTKDEMRGRLSVHFNGEEGIDAGGLTREW